MKNKKIIFTIIMGIFFNHTFLLKTAMSESKTEAASSTSPPPTLKFRRTGRLQSTSIALASSNPSSKQKTRITTRDIRPKTLLLDQAHQVHQALRRYIILKLQKLCGLPCISFARAPINLKRS
jgi:hypothetical protein